MLNKVSIACAGLLNIGVSFMAAFYALDVVQALANTAQPATENVAQGVTNV